MDTRPRPDRDQERSLAVAELDAGHLLEATEVLQNLLPQPLGAPAAGPLVVHPGLGGDREPRRHRDAQVGHLGELAAFPA